MRPFPKHHYWLLAAWFLLNLIQAGTTGLMNDEAYYWVYTQFPDWGYLDHPPGVMISIWLGELLGHFPVTLRLVSVILSTASLWLLVRLMPGKDFELKPFLLLFLSFPLIHVFGFITVPDTPLLFFCTLYFFVLRAYLKEPSDAKAGWLLLAVVGMVYSKYHAVLVLFFTLLALPKLLADRRFYVILIGSVLLYLPHIIWQVVNDYPSIQYHLFERSDTSYEFELTTSYLTTQLLILGPLTFWFIFRSTARYLDGFSDRFKNPERRFRRVMLLQFWGFLGFFFLMSFKGRVEGNWTAPLMIPALYLSYSYLTNEASERLKKVLNPLLIASFLLMVVLRVLLIVPVDPISTQGNLKEFHWNKQKVLDIHEAANDVPVVFSNSYQFPSLYWYYTGIPAHSESNIRYRLTQYDLWSLDTSYTGKRVAWVSNGIGEKTVIEHDFNDRTFFTVDSPFYSLHALSVEGFELPDEWSRNIGLKLNVSVRNTASYPVYTPRGYSYGIAASFKKEKSVVDTIMLQYLDETFWEVGEEKKFEVVLDRFPEPGRYKMRVSLQKEGVWPTLTGRPKFVQITD